MNIINDNSNYFKNFLERFYQKITIDIDTQCWNWTGKLNKDGYGQIRYKNNMFIASRASYQIYFGEILNNSYVLHVCDNSACVNPMHLFLGSQKDNMVDMINKGRSLKGSKNPIAKLKEKDIENIITDFYNGNTRIELSKKFNVSTTEINYILNQKTWNHVKYDYSKNDKKYKKLSPNQVKEIKDLLIKNISKKEIAQRFNVSRTQIYYIDIGKQWVNI